MAQLVIITTPENSGEGTPLATAFDYCNSNFSELYSRVQSPPPATLVGSTGDQAGMYAYDPTYFYYCYADYDGSSVIWAQVQQAGNITATQIQYGNSSVDIVTPGANVTIAVNGSNNRVVFSDATAFFNTTVYANANLVVAGTTFANNIAAIGNIIGNTSLFTNGNVTGNIVYSNVLVHTGGQVSAVGNITTTGYFIGEGSQLTGVSVANGTSSLSIPTSNGNVLVNVGGATIGTFTSVGLNVSTVSATGNIQGNYILGNGSQLTGLPATYANANVAAYLPTYTGNITANVISAAGNVQGANVLTTGTVSAVGNIVTDGYFVGTFIGNVSGNFVVPGANTQVLYNTNGNADAVAGFTFNTAGPNLLTVLGTISAQANVVAGNVRTVLVSASGNIVGANISATGNVTANYFIGSGSQLTGLYANANVAAYLPTYSGNIGAALVSATGNVIGGNILTAGIISATGNIFSSGTFSAVSYSASGNITGANLNASVAVVAVGNITGSNLITGGYVLASGNVTGSNLLTAGLISATGNITGANLRTAGLISAGGNVTGGNILTVGLVSATGNITGGNILGNGRAMTGILFSNTSDATAAGLTVDEVYLSAVTALSVTNSGASAYLFDQFPGNNPTIYATAGSTLAFRLAVTGHPFLIQSSGANYSTGLNHVTTSGTVTTDSSAQGQVTGTLYWKIPGNISGTYTYQCSVHGGMVGNIVVSSPTPGSFESISAVGNVTGGNIRTAGLVTATGNVTAGNITTAGLISATGNITTDGVITVNSGAASAAILNGGANGAGNIGTASGYFNTLFATASKALYADLAENYTADADYAPGTVVSFDGSAEITQCNTDMCATVAGVISTRPAYTMNSGIEGIVATVALVGRVPCRVKGPVKRGAMMVSAGDGCARAETSPAMGTVIGKALQSFDGETGTIEIVVGRL